MVNEYFHQVSSTFEAAQCILFPILFTPIISQNCRHCKAPRLLCSINAISSPSCVFKLQNPIARTNVASVGSVFNNTRKLKVLSPPETIKEKIKEKIDVSSEGPSSGVSSANSRRRAFAGNVDFFLYRFR